MEGMSLVNALIWEAAIHIGMEYIVDRTPILRNFCRANTMRQMETEIKTILGKAIKDSINPDLCKD